MEFSSSERISDDIFHCGKCNVSFTSLTNFFIHKRESCSQPNQSKNPLTINTPATFQIVHHNSNLLYNNLETYVCIREQQIISSVAPSTSVKSDERTHTTCDEEQFGTRCSKCNKKFRSTKNLSVHLRTHEGHKPFQCPICGTCFSQNTHLQRHLQTHRVWPDGLSRTVPAQRQATASSYSCSYCDVLLPNYTKFRVHLKIHSTEKQYKCIHGCSKLFIELEDLLRHVADEHRERVYSCSLCDYSCSSLEEMSCHQQNHPKESNVKTKNKYKCNQCDASFLHLDKLTFHMATHSHSRACARCNKTFSSEKRLRSHLRIHENIKPFQCSVCNTSFRLKKYLTTHMLRHGDPLFSCSQCDNKFKRKDLLSRHFKIHQKRKLLECPFKNYGCSSKFSRKDKLSLHLKSHIKSVETKVETDTTRMKKYNIKVSKKKIDRATSPITINTGQ